VGAGFRDGKHSPQNFACVSRAYATINSWPDDDINNAPRNVGHSASAATTISSELMLDRNS
jgi:hypothetical protein